MEKEKELSIHLKYLNTTCILTTTRSEFLSKACSKYGINEEDIEVHERVKKTLKKIDVCNLKDFSHIEIMKKQPVSTNQINGHRQAELPDIPSNSIVAAMCSKLKENQSFTTTESKLLLSHLQSLPPYLKRRLDSGNTDPIEMKNRKIQANPVDQKVVYTQTDKLIELSNSKASTSSTEKNIQQEIKRYAKKEKRDPELISELMTKSYQARRNLIMIQKPMVLSIRESYPLLFNMAEVRNELDRILYVGKSDEFLANIERYADIILHMPDEKDPLLKTIKEKVKGYETLAQKKYALQVGSILMLSNLIGESRCFLKLRDASIDPGDHPYIEGQAKLNEIFFDQYTFKVYTERVLLCEAADFKEAVLALMASFFIFNISYPDSSFNTLVMMEKLYLEACDTEDCDIEDNIRQIIKTIQLKLKARQR